MLTTCTAEEVLEYLRGEKNDELPWLTLSDGKVKSFVPYQFVRRAFEKRGLSESRVLRKLTFDFAVLYLGVEPPCGLLEGTDASDVVVELDGVWNNPNTYKKYDTYPKMRVDRNNRKKDDYTTLRLHKIVDPKFIALAEGRGSLPKITFSAIARYLLAEYCVKILGEKPC